MVLDSNGIEIHEELISFFKRQPHLGIYIRLNPDISSKQRISYETIKGPKVEIPSGEAISGLTEIELPFVIHDEHEARQSDAAAKYLIRHMFPKFETREVTHVERSFMLNGGTKPIKLRYKRQDSMCKIPVYAKQASMKRLFGLFVYNLISDHEQVKFGFNQGIFAEKQVSGTLLSQINETGLLHMPEYREGLMRTAVQMDFLGSYDIRKDNRLIGNSYKTILFDFDNIIFIENPTKNPLLNSYSSQLIFNKNDAEIMLDEQAKIYCAIREKSDLFFDFLEAISSSGISKSFHQTNDLKGFHDKTLEERTRNSPDFKNLAIFYDQKLKNYSNSLNLS